MPEMFCFQCQQTAGNKGCVRTGVCGKQPDTAALQDELICALIQLATAAQDHRTPEIDRLLMDGLFTTLTNVNFDNTAIGAFLARVRAAQAPFGTPCETLSLWKGETDLVSLRSTLLFGMKGMAAYAHHAANLGYFDEEVSAWFYRGLMEINRSHTVAEWLALILEFGKINYQCMALLDRANTASFGQPSPVKVRTDIKKGPFIVVSGHDLLDLAQLLEQTDGTGVRVYTHCEMLPAHGYPELRRHPQLAGNFGTAWQSQQKEFENIPAPILFTTNCLMPPRPSYAGPGVYNVRRRLSRAAAHCPGARREKGLFRPDPPGPGAGRLHPRSRHERHQRRPYADDRFCPLRSAGRRQTRSLRRSAAAPSAASIWSAAATARIRGGIITRNSSKRRPMDSLVLTLACGKYRFNDLDLGTVAGIPRILDMGQCNDAYSAIRVALALADAFGCSINELPLTLVLSWYEQKAVCILLTLLALGVKRIYLGPTLPAFLSETVVKTLVDAYGLQPITAPEQDLDAIQGRG